MEQLGEAEAQSASASSFYRFTVTGELHSHRLDYTVSRELGISRAYAQKLIKEGRVGQIGQTGQIGQIGRIASEPARRIKPSCKVELNEKYEINVPPPEKLDLEPEDIPFCVAYSDEDIIVVDKPPGLVVHPAPGHWHGTLVHGLLHRFPELGNLNGVERPGIVHRLDSTTSGLMVVARNGLAQEKLWAEFKYRRVGKRYLALCWGTPKKKKARIELPIGRDRNNRFRMAVAEDGRDAVTDYDVIWSRGEYSLVSCVIHSGRTHQIRVHMKAIDCPLVGDSLYAPSRKNPFDAFGVPRVFLHSWQLSFSHPRDGRPMQFRSFLPQDLREFLCSLRSPDTPSRTRNL